MKEDAKPKQEMTVKADYYVTPKTVHAYDLKSARQFTEQPVWVKYGYQLTYYPYDSKRHKTDFGNEARVLSTFEKLAITEVLTAVASPAPRDMPGPAFVFLERKRYAV